jgi:hypothetical protein
MQLLEAKLPSILEKSDLTLTHLESVAAELQSTSAETLPHIPRLVTRTEGVIDQGEGVLEGMKRIWPLSEAIPGADGKSLLRRDSNE